MDTITEPLPYEWFPFLCKFRCTQLINQHDYSRLEREWWQTVEVKWDEPESNAQYNQLIDGKLEDRLGISGDEADLRWAEFLARGGLKPTLVFFGIFERHRRCQGCHRHFAAPPTDRYIESVVHRVFGMLFEEALGSGRVQAIDDNRVGELYELLDENVDA
jgi:hypothetical protein